MVHFEHEKFSFIRIYLSFCHFGYARAQYGIVKAYVQLADVRPENNKKLDVELARLRKLDAKTSRRNGALSKDLHRRFDRSAATKPSKNGPQKAQVEPRNGFANHALGLAYLRTDNTTGAMQQYPILQNIDPNLATDLLAYIPK